MKQRHADNRACQAIVVAVAAILLTILLTFNLPAAAQANATAYEIEYLLNAVGDSGCTFIRNGREHSAEGAEAHLRMKYRRGQKYAKTTEAFIERLATASSWTKKPYSMRCGDGAPMPTGDWFKTRLDAFRKLSSTSAIS